MTLNSEEHVIQEERSARERKGSVGGTVANWPSPARRLLIAGTGSGVGKTTVTLGIMRALTRNGWKVQPFKCGPDYIDPTYHTAVTGVPSRNLDSWMCGPDGMRDIFARRANGADIAIMEGVMGLYDGRRADSDEGSSASVAKQLDCPVLLVIDASGMARSAAAMVAGFQHFDAEVRIAGVIANNVGSEGHGKLLREAIESACGVPLIGFVLRDTELAVPERHLGLVPAIERGTLDSLFERMADAVEAHTDLNEIVRIAESAPLRNMDDLSLGAADSNDIPSKQSSFSSVREAGQELGVTQEPLRLALAYDAAFHFYYPDNMELLEACGFELVRFSPLADEPVPDGVDGLYIGGGFPEAFAPELAKCSRALASIRQVIEAGTPTFAECGGYMLLTERLVLTDGSVYPLIGILPGETRMGTKLAALGYREVTGEAGNFLLPMEQMARGHEFHYSTVHVEEAQALPPAYRSRGLAGERPEGAVYQDRLQLVAGYTHIHFGSNSAIVTNWAQACVAFRQKRL
ncbi:cobyrinate a,c-diamide synthase [Paenibacillus sp. OSY-SE]|uniref:cobyrinate a,c-diamide synthase n=1 Tax=Paenibacillus sp. OSY-SE TaxID=1196323 RepID=UPI0002E9E581|nr:cobyrinate a,c-diamide synthase [Paenibacillus sp. OSY-SE]